MPDEPVSSTTERILRLIELLLSQPEGVGPQELLYQLDISRSSLFELLRTLKQLGYVEQVEKRGRYRAGARLQSLRLPAPSTALDLPSAFYQELGRKSLPETLLLAGPALPDGIVVLAQVEGAQVVRSAYPTGQAIHEGLEAAAHLLQREPSEAVRQAGYALIESAERIELALPVCPAGVQAEAALVITAPAFRWTAQKMLSEWLPALRATAARLSYRLGAPFYAPYQTTSAHELAPAALLSSAEIADFLQGPWAARLACVRPDGRPHVIPVWQEWDGENFRVVAWQGSQWAEYLLQNPNVSLTVDEPWSPLRRIVARGTACPWPSPEDEQKLADLLSRLSLRYLGTSNAQALASQVQRAFLIQPEMLRGWQGLPGVSPATVPAG
jgi:DNA-binding IclR family transcriptional regulator